MSTFKLKPDKVRNSTEIVTLDETHRKIVSDFNRRRRLLPNMKKKLEKMKNRLEILEKKKGSTYTTEDIQEKSNLKSEISKIEEEIYDIENNLSEMEYYSKIDDVLMDYYEIIQQNDDLSYDDNPDLCKEKKKIEDEPELDALDKLNILSKQKKKSAKTAKRRKKKKTLNDNKHILTFFGCETTEENIEEEDEGIIKNRAILFDQFRRLLDNEYIHNQNRSNDIIKSCYNCGIDKTLIQSEGIFVCTSCGEVEMVIIESDRPNYKDATIPEKPGYPYKRLIIHKIVMCLNF